MLDLIEHLASGVKDVPLLILCLARARPARRAARRGAGATCARRRSSSRRSRARTARSSSTRSPRASRPSSRTSSATPCSTTTEGNPLFIEETVRMLLESGGEPTGIPHTVQAMISARIDRLPADGAHGAAARRRRRPHVLVGRDRGARRAPRSGRRRAPGARRARLPRPRAALDDPRRGGVPLQARADPRRRVRRPARSRPARCSTGRWRSWLAGAAGRGRARRDPRLPPRRRRRSSRRSSRAACPPELAAEAAAALEQAGRRALAREANSVARRLLVRAVGARADARAPLPRRARSLADDRLPDRLDGDARGQRGGARRRAIAASRGGR